MIEPTGRREFIRTSASCVLALSSIARADVLPDEKLVVLTFDDAVKSHRTFVAPLLKELGPVFEPRRLHPLLIPTSGDAYPAWTLDHFRRVVSRAQGDHLVVLQFHGVPDVAHPWVHTPPERFREYMAYLKENGFKAIA